MNKTQIRQTGEQFNFIVELIFTSQIDSKTGIFSIQKIRNPDVVGIEVEIVPIDRLVGFERQTCLFVTNIHRSGDPDILQGMYFHRSIFLSHHIQFRIRHMSIRNTCKIFQTSSDGKLTVHLFRQT